MKTAKGLNITLWIVQILLAFMFGFSGFMKMVTPIDQLATMGMNFVNHYSEGMVRFIGISEVLGALGLILPSALRIKPILTSLSSLGLAIIMLLACREHFSHSEPVIGTVVFFLLAMFVAYGRYRLAPIQER